MEKKKTIFFGLAFVCTGVFVSLIIFFLVSFNADNQGLGHLATPIHTDKISKHQLAIKSENDDTQSISNTDGDDLEGLKNDIKLLKTQVAQLRELLQDADLGDALSASDDIDSLNRQEVILAYQADPDAFLTKIEPFLDSQLNNSIIETEAYFNSLPEADPTFVVESEQLLNQIIQSSGADNLATAQLNELACKSSICQIDVSVLSNNPEGFSDVESFEAENSMLIELGKKFPNSRLNIVKENGKISFQGYVHDGSNKLPSNRIEMNAETFEQVNSFLNQ